MGHCQRWLNGGLASACEPATRLSLYIQHRKVMPRRLRTLAGALCGAEIGTGVAPERVHADRPCADGAGYACGVWSADGGDESSLLAAGAAVGDRGGRKSSECEFLFAGRREEYGSYGPAAARQTKPQNCLHQVIVPHEGERSCIHCPVADRTSQARSFDCGETLLREVAPSPRMTTRLVVLYGLV